VSDPVVINFPPPFRQAVALIGKRLHRQKSFNAMGLGDPKLVDICKGLCSRARDRASFDDITALLFFFNDDAGVGGGSGILSASEDEEEVSDENASGSEIKEDDEEEDEDETEETSTEEDGKG